MVTFNARHSFDAPPEAVAAAMVDEDFVASLRLPDVAAPEVVERWVEDDGTCIRARFVFTGSLDPIARKVLAGARISWVQEVRVDRSGRHGWLAVRADTQPDRLRCGGEYTLAPDGAGTVRDLRGHLEVRVPLIGSRAERHILPGLLRRIDVEAEEMRAWLSAAT